MRIKELILDYQYRSFIRVVFSLIFFLKKGGYKQFIQHCSVNMLLAKQQPKQAVTLATTS